MIILSTRAAHQFGRWLRFICGAKTFGSVFTPGALPLAIDDALSGLNNVNKQVTNLSSTAMELNLSQTRGTNQDENSHASSIRQLFKIIYG